MILAFGAPISLPPPPVAGLPAASAQAVSRTSDRLPRVDQVAMIAPLQARRNQHREGSEPRLGGLGTATDDKARDPFRDGRANLTPPAISADAGGGPMTGSLRFLAQLIGQSAEAGGPSPLAGHRDGASLGSQAYRRAGADPALYSEDSALIRFAA